MIESVHASWSTGIQTRPGRLFRYNPANGSLQEVEGGATGLQHAIMPGATASDNRVFVVGGFSGRAYYRNFLTLNQYADLLITAQVDIDPDTLNLRSQGQWITAYIELPLGYDPRNIELASVRIRGTIPAIADPRYSFVTDPNVYLTDKDGDGILERMVKFDRGAVQAGLSPGSVELVVTGKVAGLNFQGSDTIRVIE